MLCLLVPHCPCLPSMPCLYYYSLYFTWDPGLHFPLWDTTYLVTHALFPSILCTCIIPLPCIYTLTPAHASLPFSWLGPCPHPLLCRYCFPVFLFYYLWFTYYAIYPTPFTHGSPSPWFQPLPGFFTLLYTTGISTLLLYTLLFSRLPPSPSSTHTHL